MFRVPGVQRVRPCHVWDVMEEPTCVGRYQVEQPVVVLGRVVEVDGQCTACEVLFGRITIETRSVTGFVCLAASVQLRENHDATLLTALGPCKGTCLWCM